MTKKEIKRITIASQMITYNKQTIFSMKTKHVLQFKLFHVRKMINKKSQKQVTQLQ